MVKYGPRGRPAMRVLLPVALLGLLAGCVTPPLLEGASVPGLDAVLGEVKLLQEGGFEMEVPVHVYLLGFPPEVAEQLSAKLADPVPIEHGAGSLDRKFPPQPGQDLSASFLFTRAPTQPIAAFRVHDLDTAIDEAFLAAAPAWAVPETDGMYDANAAEAHIAAALREAGVALDRANPVFVILHAEALGEHGWRHTFDYGYIQNVRIFGEREPVVIFDTSARPDPYVVGAPSMQQRLLAPVLGARQYGDGYNVPLAVTGEETIDALAALTVDSAHYRFLKGPIYPITTRPCHHVTLLYAIQSTAATETFPGYTRAKDLIDVASLESTFENLTGDEVMVDLKVLQLPQDEPMLDAISRSAAVGSFSMFANTAPTLDALRWYLDENFERFVTLQEGCEEYLSLLLIADSATVGAFGGIGTYDVDRSHRISFSIVSDTSRLRSDTAPAPLKVESPARQWNYVNLLYSHETGHLFGQHHPQHLVDAKGEIGENSAFEGVYSVMSYQQGDRNHEFGAVDYATWTRGRVGYTIRDAQALDLVDTPEFEAALAQLRSGRWAEAHKALEPLVQTEGHEHPEALAHYTVFDQHPHPWT